jgi:hypothetical protein
MKKLFLLAAVAVFGLTSVNAQMDVKFGVKAGVNVATIGGDFGISDVDEETDTKSKIGFHIGGVAELMLSEKFALQPELLYSQQGATVEYKHADPEDNFDQETTFSYIHVPIMAKFFPIENFSIELGPQFGFLVSDNDDYSQDWAKPEQGEENEYKSFDFGLNFGLGYKLENGVNFTARYNFGITEVDDTPNDLDFGFLGDTFSRKNRVLQVSVGYMF